MKVYHSTTQDNLDSILEQGLIKSATNNRDLTKQIEFRLEEYRPKNEYPSRIESVFAYTDIGIARNDKNDVVLSFKVEDVPCEGYAVHQAGELMGIAHMIREDIEGDKRLDHNSFEESAINFWNKDVSEQISNASDFRHAQNEVYGDLIEMYFPCNIPPEIIEIES
jgi:hypothetical protein